ncbi:uncharacterized protein LOC105203718 [Solenopsis invicta]|uniref:uncharacterized protein LOC105203718 n=1 Tax=Solenopsis invicta TaxID=13686 RepID=UPI0005962B6F|nr:uncharacterized protein LOC105203718 [Solenopsis invicta]
MERRVRRRPPHGPLPRLPYGLLCRRYVSGGWGDLLEGRGYKGELGGGMRCRRNRGLGAEGGPTQNESHVFFHDGFCGPPPQASVLVGRTQIQVGTTLKYLGLTLDGWWGFVEQFDDIAPRLGKRANALRGLMPNLRGIGATLSM